MPCVWYKAEPSWWFVFVSRGILAEFQPIYCMAFYIWHQSVLHTSTVMHVLLSSEQISSAVLFLQRFVKDFNIFPNEWLYLNLLSSSYALMFLLEYIHIVSCVYLFSMTDRVVLEFLLSHAVATIFYSIST